MKKRVKITIAILGGITLVALAGMYKFNVLQDDIYLSGKGMDKADEKLFYGSWVEPIPGNESEYQGFKLNPDGTASSINMATLLYSKWSVKNGKLILTAESIGNSLTSVSDESYDIESIGQGKLYLKYGENSFIYEKKE